MSSGAGPSGRVMPLRNGTVKGQVVLPRESWPRFEAGVAAVFSKWMALRLAVENGWGGRASVQKADELIDDVLQWFTSKREHYADELELELDEVLQVEFNTAAEDGSCGEVAQQLVAMYKECLVGDFSTIERLEAAPVQPLSACAADGAAVENTVGDGMDSSSSEDEEDEDLGEGEGNGAAMEVDEPPPKPLPLASGPVVDADGFTVVQRRHRR